MAEPEHVRPIRDETQGNNHDNAQTTRGTHQPNARIDISRRTNTRNGHTAQTNAQPRGQYVVPYIGLT